MKRLLAAALAASVAVVGVSAAEARDGCGPGGWRGPHGHCHAGGPGPVVVAPGLVIGQYYGGRGYWDGNRYWPHRDRWHGGWRYR